MPENKGYGGSRHVEREKEDTEVSQTNPSHGPRYQLQLQICVGRKSKRKRIHLKYHFGANVRPFLIDDKRQPPQWGFSFETKGCREATYLHRRSPV